MNATLPSTRPVIAAPSASLLGPVCPAAVTMPPRRDLPRAAAASLRLSGRQARARIRQGTVPVASPGQDAVALVAGAGDELGEDLCPGGTRRCRRCGTAGR